MTVIGLLRAPESIARHLSHLGLPTEEPPGIGRGSTLSIFEYCEYCASSADWPLDQPPAKPLVESSSMVVRHEFRSRDRSASQP